MNHLTPEMRTRAEKLVALYPEPRSALIPLCHLAQEQDGYLVDDAMIEIAEIVGVTPAEVRGTATFYDMLHTDSVGRYVVGVCTNIARRGLARGPCRGNKRGRPVHARGDRVPGRLRHRSMRAGQPSLCADHHA